MKGPRLEPTGAGEPPRRTRTKGAFFFCVCVCRDVLAAAALPLRFCPYVPPFVRFFSILPSDRSERACSVQRAAFYFFASCGPQPVFLSEYLNALGSRPNLDRYKSAYKVNYAVSLCG